MRLLTLILLALPVVAQPSGGPYGPIEQRYEVPKAPHVFFVAPDGKPDAAATLEAPTSLAAAVQRATTGDAIILRGGTYRTGGLVFNQGLTFQPYLSERPVLKGTQIATKWETLRGGLWRTKWTTLFPAEPLGWWQRRSEGMRTPLHRFNNDMVFVDGKFLRSAGWEGELDANSYFIDYKTGYVYIATNPAQHLVEITAFDVALLRVSNDVNGKSNDHKGPVIRGITFTQYAYRALEIEGKKHFTSADEPTDEPVGLADPATFGKESTGALIENVTVSFCSRVGGYFRGDGLIIRNSLFSDTSTEGIYVIGSSDVLLERNIIRRNNIEPLTGYYPSAVKIFNQTRRVICRDNLVLDNPDSNGIWYDVGNRDAVFVNNYIENAQVGFFFEISRGATVAGNVFVRCGRGLWALNSADVHIYNNTFVDTPATFERNERSAAADHFGWHPATGPDVHEREGHIFVNNLLVASSTYTRPLFQADQPNSLCKKLTKPTLSSVAGNLYVRPENPAEPSQPLIVWSPMAGDACTVRPTSLAGFQKLVPNYETGSSQLDASPRTIFQGPDLNRYNLRQALPQSNVSTPPEVLKLLGWSPAQARTPGAFPAPK